MLAGLLVTSTNVSPNLKLLSSTLNTKYASLFDNPSDADADEYFILSPVFKLWLSMLKLFVEVVTPLDGQVIGLINIDWVSSSNLTSIDDEVPIPTESFGVKLKSMISPSSKLCAVVSDTTASIRCKVPVTWVGFDSKRYSKLLEPTVVSPTKDNPSDVVVKPTCVTIPI